MLLLCPLPLRARLRAAIPPDLQVVVLDDWAAAMRASGSRDGSERVAIVVVPRLDRGAEFELNRFRVDAPNLRLVLVTHVDPDNARRALRLPVDEIVWLERVERELGPAIARARTSRLLQRAMAELSAIPRVPRRLRRALLAACQSTHPIASVHALARESDCHRSTLEEEWRAAVAAKYKVRLKDMLDWLVLLRAVERRAEGISWERVAEELGSSPQTLGRQAKRLTRRTLGELSRRGPEWVFAIWRDWVVPLFDGYSDISADNLFG